MAETKTTSSVSRHQLLALADAMLSEVTIGHPRLTTSQWRHESNLHNVNALWLPFGSGDRGYAKQL